MSVPFAINGLGRIGRALLRITRDLAEVELVAVNDVADPGQLARLIALDTLHGRYGGTVAAEADHLLLDGAEVRVFQEPSIPDIPWPETRAAIVVDATGLCKNREAASGHLGGGVDKVLVSANAEGMDKTLCVGVNETDYDPARHHILSGASCTTNCLAPIAYLLDRQYGIRQAFLNTVHSYNNDQSLLESPHRDPRRARAAALNMIPTTTSAVAATVRVLPQLEGKLEGFAIRVPTPNVSLIDLVVSLEAPASVEELNRLFTDAAQGEMSRVLDVSSEELVSSDFLRNPASAIVDLPLTQSVGDRLFRVVAWYDNEWAHACRLADLLLLACTREEKEERSS